MFCINGKEYTSTKIATEDEFENIVLENQAAIFPNFILFETKSSAETKITGERTHCDLCLVSKTCEQWFIIEVEIQKGDGYTRGHIQQQLAKQADADWSSLVTEMQTRMKKEGASKGTVSRLDKVDPGLMLIIDEKSPMVERVCDTYGFILAELQPMSDGRGNMAIRVMDRFSLPSFDSGDIVEISQSDIKTIAGEIYIKLPIGLVEEISNSKNCSVHIDGKVHNTKLTLKDQIVVPIPHGDPEATSSRLAYRTIGAGFSVDNDGEDIILRFVELEVW